MKHIQLFEKYNKSWEEEISRIKDLMETSWVEGEFVKSICKKKSPDYETDDEESNSPDDNWEVWIEINDITPEAFKDIDKDYNTFASKFEAWAKENNMYDPEILTTDNSMTFKVTI